MRFCEKSVDVEFGSKSPLDPKFGPWDPNPLKTDCWGPGESIDTHIVGFCDRNGRGNILKIFVTKVSFI